MKSIIELKVERDKVILEMADKIRKNIPDNVTQRLMYIIDTIYNSKAPRYYVSYPRARKIVYRYLHNLPVNITYEHRAKMYESIVKRLKDYNKINNLKETDLTGLEHILASPTDSFYITKLRILNILYSRY